MGSWFGGDRDRPRGWSAYLDFPCSNNDHLVLHETPRVPARHKGATAPRMSENNEIMPRVLLFDRGRGYR